MLTPKKPSIVLVYDPAHPGSFALCLNGSLVVTFSDELGSYYAFLKFLDLMSITYEERDMPKNFEDENFPERLVS